MKLKDLKQMKTAVRPVVGERYTINGYEIRVVDDRFNPGEKRELVILSTDKGNIYAPSSFARALLESVDAGERPEDDIIGETVTCREFYSKRASRTITVLAFD